MPLIAIYTRVSSDPFMEKTSTSRQEAACRAFAALRGWDVAAVYEDRDRSAYQKSARRPAFERLQADLAGLDGVLVWRLDRLVRRPADFERFWGRCEEMNAFLASATEPVDSSSEVGVAILRVLVTFAQLESHAKSQRLRLKQEELARGGAPPTKEPAYGHSDAWTRVVPHEAALIRDAAKRFLNGETFDVIAASFNHAGRLTRLGNRWNGEGLRRILIASRVVGDRSHRGVVVARDCWPAILDRPTQQAIIERVASARRTKPMKRGLLTGWLICSRCGGRLTGADPNNGYPRYQCQSNWYVEGGPKRHVCGLSISSLPTDTWLRHNITWRSRLTARWDPRLLRLVPTPLTETTWEALTRDEKRTHISQHLQRIIVHPHGGTGMWQESRLEPTWLTTLPPAPPFEWKTYAFDRELLSDRNRINAYEAARILDVHPSDLRRFRAKGKLVTLDRDRRRWVYSRANVEEFAELRSQERKARAEKRI